MEIIEIIDIVQYQICRQNVLVALEFTMSIKDKDKIDRKVNIICDPMGKHILAIDYENGVSFEFADGNKRIQDCKIGDIIEVSWHRIPEPREDQIALVTYEK